MPRFARACFMICSAGNFCMVVFRSIIIIFSYFFFFFLGPASYTQFSKLVANSSFLWREFIFANACHRVVVIERFDVDVDICLVLMAVRARMMM
jgi:hypothetical protein